MRKKGEPTTNMDYIGSQLSEQFSEQLIEPVSKFGQASEFFHFFAEKINAVFWVRDNTFNKQLFLSPGYENVWGRTRESLYEDPESWWNSIHPEDRDIVSITRRYEMLEQMGGDVRIENRYRIFKPNGEMRWIKDTSFSIQNKENDFIGFAGIAEDITKEILHEQKLREAIERAEIANQAKSDFLAMISHELRTPLNAILGMAQILKAKDLPKESEEYVDIISNAGSSLLSLVSDILDFARLEAGKLSFSQDSFDLWKLITKIVQSLQYQVREVGIELILDYQVHLPGYLVGDANRVRQVLVNLLSNAIKFTEKGTIRVIVTGDHLSESEIVISVSVIDTGIGIHEDKLESIFEKFSQVDSIYHRKHRGIGLGLTITKQLVEAMGGHISVISEFGVGSTFTFTLPFKVQYPNENYYHGGSDIETLQLEHPERRNQHNMNVLLVEDNLINQKIAKVMLEDFGCCVDIVDRGETILSMLDDLTKYQIIFMDVGLPDMSGYDIVKVLRKIKELNHIPIVAMTAHILERDRQNAFDSGMDRIVPKPITYEDIAIVLDEYAKK